ncbi:MAG: hypothetical protein HGA45_13055 [Chloroflexales bacterium]|nr:hypothetical protein [Chloroflexales bacterium]
MLTLGDVFRRYGPTYRASHGAQLSSAQRQAMLAIEQCRTVALGGHVYACPDCHTLRYSYHSCRNRHCPTCQQEATQAWLAQQQALLLPLPYFLVTFTLPAELRPLARRNPQKHLPSALSILRSGAPATCTGPTLSGWADRHARGLADLDA